ncbi:MAG: SusC/RagA family TonB-linked outer membrane protein [Flavobacterium sp.]|uniref:SusC/RagA family TonB-linked outer membrane protein n=1 Tax=Flavobacterium sp. TaxID=239 RepID=UPI001212EEEF|nr:SusC/RagA family TonB-linked outer membrane protein [Flavobacterium sp.]RZJ64291.1 MAG: SusC/RagA family TonB-linked outer membrane protein [Flavobacterium sp.]
MRSKFKWIFTLLVAFTMQFSFAQEKTVTGTVSDDAGPLPGANVVVKETKRGVQTDVDGKYSIQVAQGQTLVFTFVGMSDQEVKVGASNSVNIKLEAGGTMLGEVVVTTALGIRKGMNEITASSSVVKAETLNQANNPNAVQALVGKVSGLQINTTSNSVNPDTRIVLRGNRSISGNNAALVVIDGAISTTALLQSLDPAIIENVNVLKGMQGAALYGQDGKNGVIIVTTKKGNGQDKFTVGLSASLDFEEVAFLPERQGRYGQGWNGVFYSFENGGWGPQFDGSIQPVGLPQADGSYIMSPFSSRGSDNIKEFFQTGTTEQNKFSLSYGDSAGYIYFAADRTSKNFIVDKDTYNRKGFLFKAGKKLGKWNLDAQVNYITSKTAQTSSFLMYNLVQAPLNVDISQFANSGNEGAWSYYITNPYWSIDNDRQEDRLDYFNGTLKLQYDFNEHINVLVNSNVRSATQSGFAFTSAYDDPWQEEMGFDQSTQSDFTNYNSNSRYIYTDFMANFDYNLGSNFTFKANVGANFQDTLASSTQVGAINFVIDGLYNVSNLSSDPTTAAGTSNSISRFRSYGFFGQVDLGFKEYLFLNLTGRNDWSSVLPESNNNYFYPSAGISFIPTKAFPSIKGDVLSYMKVLANITKVGSYGPIGAYSIERLYTPGTGYPFNTPGFLQSTTLTDPNIKPEFFVNKEVGLSLGFFNERLTLDAAYFRTDNTDLITSTQPSYASGFTAATINIGEAHTTGGEIELGFVPINMKEIGLRWENKLSYTTSKMVVDKVSDTQSEVTLNTGYNTVANSNVGIYAQEGQEFPLIKGTAYVRDDEGHVVIDADTGMPLYSTSNEILGKATPDYILGYSTSLSYKGLRLSAVFDYRTGHQFYSQMKQTVSTFGYLVESAQGGRTGFVFPNSVITTGTDGVYAPNNGVLTGGTTYTSYQEYNSANYNEVAENFVLDATAFKVREIALSYTFSPKVLDKTGLASLNVGVNGRNLFTVLPKENRGYSDPEASVTNGNAAGYSYVGRYPTTRTYGFSINLTF